MFKLTFPRCGFQLLHISRDSIILLGTVHICNKEDFHELVNMSETGLSKQDTCSWEISESYLRFNSIKVKFDKWKIDLIGNTITN